MRPRSSKVLGKTDPRNADFLGLDPAFCPTELRWVQLREVTSFQHYAS